MYRLFIAVLITLLVAAASSCATKRQTGAAAGAAAGTAVGAAVGDTEGAIIGGLLGTIVGHEVGRYMDKQDRERTRDVLEYNETGETSDWVNPDTGYRYEVTPRDTRDLAGNEPCREFDIITEDDGVEYRTTEVACRRPDGVWEIHG